MPDDASRWRAMTPPVDVLLSACATRAVPTDARRSAITGAVEAIDAAIRDSARETGQPVERYWRDVLGRLRLEVRQPHDVEIMAGLLQGQALVLAHALPMLGPDNLDRDV